MFEVTVEETFAAGHALRGYVGKCENVHGHNYKVQVTLEGEQLNAAGLLIDFVELKHILRAIIERLDHKFLNDIPPFDNWNPSAENMARFFYEEVEKGIAVVSPDIRVASAKVWETDTTTATYSRRPNFQ